MSQGSEGGFGQAPPGTIPGGGKDIDARRKVTGPAIGLMITAVVGVACQLFVLLAHLLGMGFGALGGGREALGPMLSGSLGSVFSVMGIIFGVVVFMAALRMKELQSHTFAVVAAILAVFPCTSPCCVLGIPIGIWALVVLLNANVRAAFTS